MKPTIFFSHSSLDSERIKPIKDYILDKTGNAVQVFMSSDGASIPFGKNWLKEIEEALANCKLMFVWITPNSSKSNWIYFESGYAYARGIKVVPIGFDGIKLENLPAPLNFLQGFNINSASSLNNIIAIVNQEFGLTFPNFFDEIFYKKSVQSSSTENSPELLNYISNIRCVFYPEITSKDNDGPIVLKKDWINIVREILKERKEIYGEQNNKIYGVGYKIYGRSEREISYPEVFIDPLSLNNIWHLLTKFNKGLYGSKHKNLIFFISLKPPYNLPDDHFLISSRLINTEVDFNTEIPNVLYGYRNILFRMNITNKDQRTADTEYDKELVLIVDQDNKDQVPLLSLVKLFEKQMVIDKR